MRTKRTPPPLTDFCVMGFDGEGIDAGLCAVHPVEGEPPLATAAAAHAVARRVLDTHPEVVKVEVWWLPERTRPEELVEEVRRSARRRSRRGHDSPGETP